MYGNWDRVYIQCQRLSASKYSYQFPICEIDENIRVDYFAEIQNKKPAAVVVQDGYKDQFIENFVSENEYFSVWEKDGNEVYIR